MAATRPRQARPHQFRRRRRHQSTGHEGFGEHRVRKRHRISAYHRRGEQRRALGERGRRVSPVSCGRPELRQTARKPREVQPRSGHRRQDRFGPHSVTAIRDQRSPVSVTLVRRGLYALTVIGILATAFELATVRHWLSLEQLIPWAALVVTRYRDGARTGACSWGRIAAGLLALLVLGASVYGVLDHTVVNYNSGPLDQRFADTWDSLPPTQRWWYAITKTVGPAPTLAPGILGETAVLLLLANLMPKPTQRAVSRAPRPYGGAPPRRCRGASVLAC